MATRRVLLVGETWSVTRIHTKGFDVVELGGYEDFSTFFREAMSGFAEVEVTHIPNHLVMSSFPTTVEDLAAVRRRHHQRLRSQHPDDVPEHVRGADGARTGSASSPTTCGRAAR